MDCVKTKHYSNISWGLSKSCNIHQLS